MSRHSTDVLFGSALLILSACSHPAQPAAPATVEAPVGVVMRTTLPTYHTVAGTVRSEISTTVSANVVGTIVRVLVAEGDRVRAGAPLVEIDARERKAQFDQARTGRDEVERAIDGATANARLAEATFQRIETLHARGSASTQERDEARARLASAQAELARLGVKREQARAAAVQSATILGYSTIRAPADGVVTARFVDSGAQAAPGVPLLAFEQESARRVDVTVPESMVVTTGSRAIVTSGENEVGARVTRVQPSVDARTRSGLVKLELDQPLRSGSYVRASFPLGDRPAITVPKPALVRRGQLISVFVLDQNEIARMRLITIGKPHGDQMEVLSGLSGGESIVLEPGRVRDGMRVRRGA